MTSAALIVIVLAAIGLIQVVYWRHRESLTPGERRAEDEKVESERIVW